MKTHNTHMLIPDAIWSRLKGYAASTGVSKTAIVCRALVYYLNSQERKRKK